MNEAKIRRSLLFIPGSSMKMLKKGPALPCDVIIVDLEDAVSPEAKDLAREQTISMLPELRGCGKEILIRINGMDTIWGLDDMQAIVPCMPDGIVLPKAVRQSILIADGILTVLERKFKLEIGSIALLPLLESAEAILTGYEILGQSGRINGVLLGAEDLTKELEAARTAEGEELTFARSQMVFAAKARGIEAYDTPFTSIKDEEGLKQDTKKAKAFGFSGKLCIHPAQLEAVNQIFTPAEEEIAMAKGIVSAMVEADAAGKGACVYRGKMIDPPVVERARKILKKAERIGVSC